MIDLRKLARGKPCLVRVDEHCDGGGETTVLAHVRLSGVSGMGLKAPDVCAAFCCGPCHARVDGQVRCGLSKDELELALLRGMVRTLYELTKLGVL
jgi:hypothetical protein